MKKSHDTNKASDQITAAVNIQANRDMQTTSLPTDTPSSFSELPKRNTTWPNTYQGNGEKGWSAPQQWVERFGEKYGISSTNALRQLVVSGHLTVVTVDRLGELLGGLSSKPSAAKDAYIYNDPSVIADPGPLTAVAWLKNGTGGVSTTAMPGVRTTIGAVDRSDAYAAIAAEAKNGTNATAIRIAWTTSKGAARLVEYLDVASGTTRPPTAEEDIEAAVEVRSVRLYSQHDQADDLIATIKAANEKPVAQTKAAPTQETVNQTTKDWLESAVQSSSPMAKREALFALSRSFAGRASATPTAKSSHIVYLAKSASDLSGRFSDDGFARVHAGIISNFGSMMPTTTNKGMMDETSRILIAFREGDVFTITFASPYSGLEPGTGPAANLLLSRSGTEKVGPIQISMRNVGMLLPNLPFIVSREHSVDGFNVPASARRAIWSAVHTAMGWGLE